MRVANYFEDDSKFCKIKQAGKSIGWRVVLDDSIFSNYRVNYKMLHKLSENDMETIQFRLIGLSYSYAECSESTYLNEVVDILNRMLSWYLGKSLSGVFLIDLIKSELLAPEMPVGIKELLNPTLDFVFGKEYMELNVISLFDCCDLFSILIKMKSLKSV